MELTVKTSHPYQIVIERGCLQKTGTRAAELFRPGSRVLIVSDSNVIPLYGDCVESALKQAGFLPYRYVFPAGESSKRLSTIESLYTCLIENHFTRTDFIVALGGGVTGDMAGFAAATFLRGIGFIQIPTSLLAQIDSSVGGKTGVDLPQGKNLIGAFHQPRLVLIDPTTLSTLPPRFFSDGMGEAIKYGCIRSESLFEAIITHDMRSDFAALDALIAECIDIKRQMVENDEFDTGERMLLNFGHTFGHAMEKLYKFEKLTHGEAVGIGMVMMARAGESKGITALGTAEKIRLALQKYNLPTSDSLPLDQIVGATSVDKKSTGGQLNLVLLRKIGDAFVYRIDRSEMAAFTAGCQDA